MLNSQKIVKGHNSQKGSGIQYRSLGPTEPIIKPSPGTTEQGNLAEMSGRYFKLGAFRSHQLYSGCIGDDLWIGQVQHLQLYVMPDGTGQKY
jgi:hypothetical protein